MTEAASGTTTRDMGRMELAGAVAAMMALGAFAIDAMLPSLGAIGADLGAQAANGRQWVITAFLLGFGASQLAFGPLSDRYGRRPVLVAGAFAFVAASLAAAWAESFEAMLAARTVQGVGASALRVVALSVVRDRSSGREMARTLSLSYLVFTAVPVVAPSVGEAVMSLGSWRVIFAMLAAFGAALAGWCWLRLPETLPAERRTPLSPRAVAASWRVVLGSRTSVGYTAAQALALGTLFTWINSAQQVVSETFGSPSSLSAVFALSAIGMGVASLTNAAIVVRLGTRLVGTVSLFGFIAMTGAHLAVEAAGLNSLWTFTAMLSATMFFFSLCAANWSAAAMEEMSQVAGVAASVQGFACMVGATLIGLAAGMAFDGTAFPMLAGAFLSALGSAVAVGMTELGGRSPATAAA